MASLKFKILEMTIIKSPAVIKRRDAKKKGGNSETAILLNT